MKHRLQKKIAALTIALLSSVGVITAQQTFTGYAMTDSEAEGFGKGVYSFQLGDTITGIERVKEIPMENLSGGQLVGDTYYYLEYLQNYNGYQVLGLYAYDMESKTSRQIADYGAVQQGPIAGNFSYGYQNGVMYGLNFFNGGDAITIIDLEKGTLSEQAKISFDYINEAAQASTEGTDHLHSMCATYDGDFYGLSYWGSLYKVNPVTGQCSYIGTLDYNPGQAFMYAGDCMFYDNNTDRLFLRFTTYNFDTCEWLHKLVTIDTKTAKVTQFADLPAMNGLNAISIPFTVAEASAPAKVQNMQVARGDSGALTVSLSWDNPTKTYGRGGTLEDLDYVLVFRNGELVDSIVNPAIGGHHTWTDNGITERGYYQYKLVCGNDIGRGDRVCKGIYVGKGDPMGVTDLAADVSADGQGAVVTWTAPTQGKADSYIDVSTLNYDIVRFKDNETKGDTIALGHKGTEYVDNAIEAMANYSYAVTPNTDNAKGDVVKTAKAVFGPAFEMPATFGFNTVEEFEIWKTIDANGNYSTWTWSDGYYGSMRGAKCNYNYDEVAAADWLISPRIRLEAGKHYKMTFDAQPASKKVPEVIAVSFGQGQEIADQDSINQFELLTDQVTPLRANLPVVDKTGDYNFGFLYRSYYANYNLSIGNMQVSEDHEGYIEGTLTCNGKPVGGATVIAAAGQFKTTTDAKGKYRLEYLPEGEYTVSAMALGYEDVEATASVKQWKTTACDITTTALPTYTVTGKVVEVDGQPVAGATVAMSGYNTAETTTAADGTFTIGNVFRNGNYSVSVTKNKLLEASVNFGVEADTDLGTITMQDNIKPAGKVSVDTTADKAEVTWKAPANDAVVQRIDDGTLTTAVGIGDATKNSMFGVVKREPATITGVQFFIMGTSSITHYSVRLNIFDLDAEGNPTQNLLYQNTYVPCADDQWNSYTLPAPVDAPNGYYMALSYDGYMLVGIDGDGDAEQYPFVKNVNCFTRDYTTGNFLYLDDQQNAKFHHNFLIRPIAAPATVAEDETEFTAKPTFVRTRPVKGQQIELQGAELTEDGKKAAQTVSNQPARTPQQRIRYNVYRMKAADVANPETWTMVSEKQQLRNYTDNEWKELGQGVFNYAVEAVYTGDIKAQATVSDSIGNNMLTQVDVNIKTLTPDNEAYGAKVTLTDGGTHSYEATADVDGKVSIPDVWKGYYNMVVVLDGFVTQQKDVVINTDNSYSFDIELEENRVKPYNLIIADTEFTNCKRFMWNYPDVFFDDFESHSAFAINSPGSIGWQYVDGDATETGAFSSYQWENAFSPMAFMVFNAYATNPVVADEYYNLTAYSGQQCLTDWASYNVPNDDWIITPQLYFANDFKFSFQAAGFDSGYPETFEVGYSTTDANPESFTMVSQQEQTNSWWTPYTYDIPKEAKYVAIHCVSDQKRIFRVDDIRFGLPEAMQAPYYLSRYSAAAHVAKSPSLDGLYEVYLDGEMIAQQDQTECLLSSLQPGNHTAGVLASYTSGKTEMSTIDFYLDATGIVSVTGSEKTVTVSGRTIICPAGAMVSVSDTAGRIMPVQRIGDSTYSMGTLPQGAYVVTVTNANGKRNTVKINL